MAAPRHTPYDGSSTPFTIGLEAIEHQRWIETDTDLGRYLDEKARHLATRRDEVFQETPEARPAEREALDLISAHLLRDHSDVYSGNKDALSFLGRTVRPGANEPPLVTAGSLVADDLVILENRDGWRATAGYVAFPSSWSLKEKAGRTIGEIHGPVPGFEAGSRNDDLINRMFDRIQPDRIVERFNWSVYPEGDLDWPPEKGAKAASRPFVPATNFVRVERQTLRKLPETGAILFTIRIYNDPLHVVTARRELAEGLAARLDAMTPDQLAYKGMTEKRERLTAFLRGL